jgi:RNA-binding protein
MPNLSPKRRSELRAEAHKLSPLVIVGDKGLTEEVIAEVDRTLKAHELIKVRANTDDRAARGEWLEALCERLGATAVQQIGKVLVLYRENPKEPAREARRPAEGERKAAGRRAPGERVRKFAKRGPPAEESRKSTPRRLPTREERALKKREAGEDERKGAIRTARPRSRTPSAPPASGPRRRRPRSSQ